MEIKPLLLVTVAAVGLIPMDQHAIVPDWVGQTDDRVCGQTDHPGCRSWRR
jgi:hypothetical protein